MRAHPELFALCPVWCACLRVHIPRLRFRNRHAVACGCHEAPAGDSFCRHWVAWVNAGHGALVSNQALPIGEVFGCRRARQTSMIRTIPHPMFYTEEVQVLAQLKSHSFAWCGGSACALQRRTCQADPELSGRIRSAAFAEAAHMSEIVRGHTC